eukprot:SAG25_NODE_12204_length_285_cov_0.833333_1_plen_73_part_01
MIIAYSIRFLLPYLLNVVDIHSRKAWSVPLKNKEPKGVTSKMDTLIDEIEKEQSKIQKRKVVVKSINADVGGE